MLKSKKGISPILATLLLIVIAVAAVIVTYAWVMTFTGTQTQNAGVMLSKEDVSWPTASSIRVVIKNIGVSDVRITGVYLGTSPTNLNLSNCQRRLNWHFYPNIHMDRKHKILLQICNRHSSISGIFREVSLAVFTYTNNRLSFH
jgi:flagellin-like protein